MNKYLKRFFYLVCTIFIVAFIFYNSFQNGESSTNASTLVLNFINNIISNMNINFEMGGYAIRKMAHFIQFFIFGFFLILTFREFKIDRLSYGYPLFLVVFIPVIDEYIQTFSVGRTASVTDVLIDFLGGVTGLVFVCIISNIFKGKQTTMFK